MPVSELTVTRRVQFFETDMAGMVHFSWYTRYMEEAEHALWREAGLGITSAPTGVAFPRVSVSVDFRAPLRFEDVFTTTIRIEDLGRRTIRYAAVMSRGDTVVAEGTMTVACVRGLDGRMAAVDIPDEIHRRLGGGAQASPRDPV